MSQSTTVVGPLQMLCLELLWNLGPLSVRTVQQAINVDRASAHRAPLAYTTVLTVMRQLAKRGFASTTQDKKRYVFAASQTRDEVHAMILQEAANLITGGNLNHLSTRAKELCKYPSKASTV